MNEVHAANQIQYEHSDKHLHVRGASQEFTPKNTPVPEA
jgi:hypothetical protein